MAGDVAAEHAGKIRHVSRVIFPRDDGWSPGADYD
jgi:hypothetical protein